MYLFILINQNNIEQGHFIKYSIKPPICNNDNNNAKFQSITPKSNIENNIKILKYNSNKSTPKLTPKSNKSISSKLTPKSNKSNIPNKNEKIVKCNCYERRYDYSYPYIPELQSNFSRDDLAISRCVSGTKDVMIMAEFQNLMTINKHTPPDYSIDSNIKDKPLPKYTGTLKQISPQKCRNPEYERV